MAISRLLPASITSNYRRYVIGFCLLVVASLFFLRYVSMILLVWSLLIGAGLAYYFLGEDTIVPNLFFIANDQNKEHENEDDFTMKDVVCTVCGKTDCPSHRPELNLLAFQPWTNTTLPLAVDTALEQFLDIVLQNFIYTWYKELSTDEEFIDELRPSIRFLAAVILRRLQKVDVSTFITTKVLKVVIHHLDSYIDAITKCMGDNREELILENYGSLHCVMHSRKAEVEYIRRLLYKLFPHILSPQSLQCQSVRTLIRELMTGSVLLPGLDALADPDMVNQLILTALDKQPTLHLHMSDVLNRENTRLLYEFIQFLKSEAAINVMQFTLHCENFNNRVLNPDLTSEQIEELHAMANELYLYYCSPDAVDRIMFDDDIVEELRQITEGPIEEVVKLRNKRCLFKAYDHAYFLLESTFLPLFHQSDFYFSMLCGEQQTSKLNRMANNVVQAHKFIQQLR